MMTRSYTFCIVVERDHEGDEYVAYSPTLAGCFAQGMAGTRCCQITAADLQALGYRFLLALRC